jgi:D-sedoheptulose 7-phosphate isomerase
MPNSLTSFIKEIIEQYEKLDKEKISRLSEILRCANKIHLFANGGSLAICSHVATDLTKACGLKATTYTDPSLISCFSNDYGYENAYKNIIKRFVAREDVVVLISSSGESLNILNAASVRDDQGFLLVSLSGFHENNRLQSVQADVNFHVSSHNYNVVETVHQTILLQAVEILRCG